MQEKGKDTTWNNVPSNIASISYSHSPISIANPTNGVHVFWACEIDGRGLAPRGFLIAVVSMTRVVTRQAGVDQKWG